MTSDPPLESLTIPGGVLTFVDEGPKGAPALVTLPGVPGSVRDFRYLAPQLTSRVRVVRVDLPGFGGSTATRAGVRTIPGRGDAVLALADHLGLREFGVLGHSMGGATALHLAAHYRPRVSALAFVASIALRAHRGMGMSPRRFGLLAGVMRVPGLGRLLLPSLRERYKRRRFPGAEQMAARDFVLQFEAVSAGDFGAMRRDLASPLPPSLVAYAEDDALVETAISLELVAALPQARVLRFAEGGHNIQKTRAPELAAAIAELLGA